LAFHKFEMSVPVFPNYCCEMWWLRGHLCMGDEYIYCCENIDVVDDDN